MWMYILICLCLSLAGVTGLQFFYMMYLERLDKEKKKRIQQLEKHCQYLASRLQNAETKIIEQDEFIDSIYEEYEESAEEEVWADVIEEG